MSDVLTALDGHQYRYADEIGLHWALEQAMRAAGLDPQPEHRLPTGRIDFLVDRVGVEVKVTGSVDTVTRQLRGYAPFVDELVLVSTRSRHRQVPREIGGKPVAVFIVQGAAW